MRNQRMDLFKCISIYSVVFLHIKSGVWDWYATALARFAVPYFFLVTGYFSYEQREHKLLKRARHALFYWCVAFGLVLLFCAAMVLRWPGSSITAVWQYIYGQFVTEGCSGLLLFQVPPFPYSYHIWFIGALPIIYLIWWGVTRLCHRLEKDIPYLALCCLAVVLLGVNILLSEIWPHFFGGPELPTSWTRNAWLEGIPFFLLGICAHRYEELIQKYLTSWLFWAGFLLGNLLALAEQRITGHHDLFVGSILTACLLLAAAIQWPDVKQDLPRRWMCACGNRLTFTIYSTHVVLYSVFFECRLYISFFAWIIDHPAVAPLFTALVSTGIAVLVDSAKRKKRSLTA